MAEKEKNEVREPHMRYTAKDNGWDKGEETDSEPTDEAQEAEPEVETKAPKAEAVTLPFDMDPSERLTKEIELSKDGSSKRVGEDLLKEFAMDANLAECYRTKKITLADVMKNIRDSAKKKAVNSCAMIEDIEVYGWAIHYVQDGEIKVKTENAVKLTPKEEKDAKAKALEEIKNKEMQRLEDEKQKALERERKEAEKAAERAKKAEEDARAKREASGQLSLFDL